MQKSLAEAEEMTIETRVALQRLDDRDTPDTFELIQVFPGEYSEYPLGNTQILAEFRTLRDWLADEEEKLRLQRRVLVLEVDKLLEHTVSTGITV